MKKLLGLALLTLAPLSFARAPHKNHLTGQACNQAAVDGHAAPRTLFTISPRIPVQPFYQWYNNNGYCGEVSLMQAALNNGQWISQFNARLICGSGLSQSGIDGFAQANQSSNFNAQLSLETALPGDLPFSSAPVCLANAQLNSVVFDAASQSGGLDGYHEYLSWIKAQLIKGGTVGISIVDKGGSDPQYDHIVTVDHIGTNHLPSDANYYDDDVLFFEDHGGETFVNGHSSKFHPAVPYGATNQGCNPYIFGYTFGSLAQTREGANQPAAHRYSIVIPGTAVKTKLGGDGLHENPRAIIGKNYAFSVLGPQDESNETLPITLRISKAVVHGKENLVAPRVKLNYESPMIGTDLSGDSDTNVPPTNWMRITLDATVRGLVPGVAYNLYKYEFDKVPGVGAEAALPVPTKNFNAQASMASVAFHFVATDTIFTTTVVDYSNKIIVFRCVRADAP